MSQESVSRVPLFTRDHQVADPQTVEIMQQLTAIREELHELRRMVAPNNGPVVTGPAVLREYDLLTRR